MTQILQPGRTPLRSSAILRFPVPISADSTNQAFTISMLLGNLSSCCNPWIYMGFNRHLWPRALRHLACCGGPSPQMRRQVSNGSLSTRGTTLLLRSSCPHTISLSPSFSGRPETTEALKTPEKMDGEVPSETNVMESVLSL